PDHRGRDVLDGAHRQGADEDARRVPRDVGTRGRLQRPPRLRRRDRRWQAAGVVGLRRELVIGKTVLGRPIEAVHFTPPDYAKPRPPAILFGAIHGDEPVSQLMLECLADELVERPPGRDTWIIPCVNVDGLLAGTRNNANDVDLNRNFASTSWGTERRPGYNPGGAAEDQPETRALVELIARAGAERLIALHAGYRMVNWDGCGEQLAKEMAE